MLAPQLPQGAPWGAPGSDALSSHAEALVQLIAALTREFLLDPDRIYLTGQSLGGQGTWDIIGKQPDLFAAAVPLCGDGNPSRVAAARRLPIWVFHGAQDPLVPVTGSRDLVAAFRAVGSPVKIHGVPRRRTRRVDAGLRGSGVGRLALRPAADDPVATYALPLWRGRVGEPLAVQAARRRRLSCRSHSPIWFQLAKFRLAAQDHVSRHYATAQDQSLKVD